MKGGRKCPRIAGRERGLRGRIFRRAREGELGRRAKRSWPGPRLGAPFLRVPRPRRAILVHSPDRARGVPAHRGRERGLRGRTAHYDSLRAAAARRLLACTLAAAREEGEHLRFSPSCESTPFPSGRAARVKALSRKTASTRLLLQHERAWLPPRNGGRPLCSDRREGCCHPGGVGTVWNRARDRRHLHHPSCLPFKGRWQRRQALTERSCRVSCPPPWAWETARRARRLGAPFCQAAARPLE